MLLELIDRLDESIGAGKSIATLRTQLSAIREQAEALEARLKALKMQIKKAQAKANKEDSAQQADAVEEIGNELLRLLARPGATRSLEMIAAQLGLQQVVAQYHADKLAEKGMIELTAYVPGRGTIYVLTPKGTAYVVENNLL
jgi:DNA-binding transcriptional ArsR family regulator